MTLLFTVSFMWVLSCEDMILDTKMNFTLTPSDSLQLLKINESTEIELNQNNFNDTDIQERLLKEIIDFTHNVEPLKEGDRTYYPGERTVLTRERNKKEGIHISTEIWKKVCALAH